jgi:hypothetical protein
VKNVPPDHQLRDYIDVYEHRSSKLIPLRDFWWRLLRHVGISATLVGGSLVMGMTGYVKLAHMSVVDAFMNSSMLLGGMGPVGDLPNDAAKIFAGVYALYAGLIFIVSASIIVAPVAHRVLHALHVEERR